MKINKKFINEVGRAFGCGLTVYTKDSKLVEHLDVV